MPPPPTKRPRVSEPEVAARLAVEGATFVLLNVPPGTEFGIDMNSWNTGEKFCGVKLIPPGVHFVYYSSVHLGTRTTAPRTGFFHSFGRGDVVVRRWDAAREDVLPSDEEEVGRVRADMRGLDGRLGVYPYESWPKWISLSNRLTEATLTRLEPLDGRICSVADLVSAPDSGPRPAAGLPAMVARPGTAIRYSALAARRFPEGSSAGQITKHSLDTTFQLDQLVAGMERLYGDQVSGGSMASETSEREVLAELQFAFLAFLVGQNYDSFEQWKRLVMILCSCDEALATRPALFRDFLGDLYFQMKEVPRDFFVDIVSSSNFLCSCLNTLFSNIQDSGDVSPELKERTKKFETNVTKRFGWDFSREGGDEAPVLVEPAPPAPGPPSLLTAELSE